MSEDNYDQAKTQLEDAIAYADCVSRICELEKMTWHSIQQLINVEALTFVDVNQYQKKMQYIMDTIGEYILIFKKECDIIIKGSFYESNSKLFHLCIKMKKEKYKSMTNYSSLLVKTQKKIEDTMQTRIISKNEEIFMVYGNQFTYGGVAACTSISLVSAAVMREHSTLNDIFEQIKWDNVLSLGTKLWKNWKNKEGRNMRSPFQTLEQIYQIDAMREVFGLLGGRPIEFGGYVNGFIPSSIRRNLSDSEKDQLNLIYISLESALEKANNYGIQTVGVVTMSIYTVSFWCNGDIENPIFVIYDSHGDGNGNSLIYIVRGIKYVTLKIRKLCHDNLSVSVGNENATGQYCMYIFKPSK